MQTSIMLMIVGVLFLSAGVFNWDWFMESRRVSFILKVIGGRERGRILYVVIGAVVLIYGGLRTFSII